jgi:hypothetical protein
LWKNIRVACLLLVLLIVAINAYRDQNQDWNQPINVLLHPINADGLPTTQQYIQQLQQDDFAEVKQYLEKIASNIEGKAATLWFKSDGNCNKHHRRCLNSQVF